MRTRYFGIGLILSLTGLLALPRQAAAQSQTTTTSADTEELAPGSSAREIELPEAPKRRAARGRTETSNSGGGGGGNTAEDERTDHQKVIGRAGVGWFGISNIPIRFSNDIDDPPGVVSAPILGIRYWMSERIGIDAGIGFAASGSSSTVEGSGMSMDEDGPSVVGILLHAGIPLALATGRHYTFTLVPELNFGYASVSVDTTAGGMTPVTEVTTTGLRFDLGGRAGAEIHFGFIDVPELTLEASVGLFISRTSTSLEQMGVTRSVGITSVNTSSFNSPWDFFRTSVAARYYF